eukprot:TRINITY_DN6548_c0_g1_i1.p1 TRINITY_DN6548_c0_g1~~TRINITY_DN6548_c0_g1_i1.p1  ORF type:complete len:134 (+),score=44.86 TRINITY_DN6548_c0_g1_i1:84-485(+)
MCIRDSSEVELDPDEDERTICTVLVKYLLGLGNDTPVWGDSPEEARGFQSALTALNKQHSGQIPAQAVRALLQDIAEPNRETLKMIAGLLSKACEPNWAETSKMDAAKFALCVMPVIQAGLRVMIEDYELVFN